MQNRRLPVFLLASTTIALAACQAKMHDHTTEAGGPLPESVRVRTLAKADWNQVQDVSLTLRDYGLSPREIRLKAGVPYKMRITNTGGVAHYFNAAEFLQSIAVRKAVAPDQAEAKANFFASFEIYRRGGSLELYFVPVRPGTYHVHCHLDGPEHEGVNGTIVVE